MPLNTKIRVDSIILMQDESVLFIQRRSHSAGAQTSLVRMLKCDASKSLRPAVLSGEKGWLSRNLRDAEIPIAITSFPRLRSFKTRIFGLGSFVRRAHAALERSGIYPSIIVANDHSECPLALELSRNYANVPVLGILRTSNMTRRDFEKFECNYCDKILVVGEELKKKVQIWSGNPVALFEEGFSREELYDFPPWSPSFPTRLLVVGSERPLKGFADFVRAIDILEEKYADFPPLECDFTGSTIIGDEILLNLPRQAKFTFLGRVDNFHKFVRNYSLIIHPSRSETFGLAPLEAILAGVPTLVSETGAVKDFEFPKQWKFPPSDPAAMAERIHQLWKLWPPNGRGFAILQNQIFNAFNLEQTIQPTLRVLQELKASRANHGSKFRVMRWLNKGTIS